MATNAGNGHSVFSTATGTLNGGNRSCCLTSFFDEGSLESHRYYLSRRTVFEMLRDRGYDVPDSELTRSLAEFRSDFGQNPNVESLRICVSHCSDFSKKVLVNFFGTADIKMAYLRGILGQITFGNRLKHLIFIVQSKMTSYAKKELEKHPFKVEIFNMNDLLVNITKHVLEPKYEVLTADEKRALLMKYKLQPKQLPHMLETDAIARYYGLEKGQVVKVTHSGELVDALVSYRCVV